LPETEASVACPSCGFFPASEGQACPQCQHPVHTGQIREYASQARAREGAGDAAGAIELWRQALLLLRPETAQAVAMREHVAELRAGLAGAQPPSPGSAAPGSSWAKRLGPLGAIAAFLAKFKSLLFGLAKLKTLFTMLASIGLYWSLYGWKFGLGFVLGIYVHEMGHVWELKQFGLRASAPMFIPGFGALVSLYDSPKNVHQDARIGLAGPIWGAAAALAFLAPQLVAPAGIWLALAHATAYINLFNLTPVWQLDGGRGFRALGQQHRMMLLGLMILLWYLSSSGLFLILALGAAYRIFWSRDHPAESDNIVFGQFAGLLILFGALLGFLGRSYLLGQ
jgi:Zn-dependent protease